MYDYRLLQKQSSKDGQAVGRERVPQFKAVSDSGVLLVVSESDLISITLNRHGFILISDLWSDWALIVIFLSLGSCKNNQKESRSFVDDAKL